MKPDNGQKVLVTILLATFLGGFEACSQGASSVPPQDRSSSQSMSLAGQDTENAARNAYQGTTTAVKDTSITAKVKVALHDDKVTDSDTIHVDTVAGVVTLSGVVGSTEESERAAQIAQSTNGVRYVVNNLQLSTHS